jgi:LPXTG-site transpeptidase (sortase) family protein
MKHFFHLFLSIYTQAAIGIVLILAGLFMWHIRTNFEAVNSVPNVASTVKASAPKAATISGEPNHIDIPSLDMSLPVINGYYSPSTQQWTLTLSDVQYATITPPPNNASGNTYLYGHYRPEVFARLHLIQIGSDAVITTTNGHTFTYQLESVRTTVPTDDSLFKYQGPPILTVQTCTGTFFQYRELFTFKLVKVA